MSPKPNSSNLSLSNADKISLVSNLATMLGAGIPILETVNSVLEDTKGSQRKVLETLKADLMQGKHLYASFAYYPRIFDTVTINLLRAAEEAGTLEATLQDLRDHIQKEMEFMDKIKFAMIYPLVIMVVFAGVLLMILTVVVPKISGVFLRLKVTLPLPTRILIFFSDLILKHTFGLLAGLLVFFAALFILYRTKKSLLTDLLFRLPVISQLVKQVDLTRFTRSMYLLLSSGIPLTTALELSQAVVIQRTTAKIISKSRDMVSSGKRLTDGLRQVKGYIPTLMIKLTESGEKSGSLDKSMGNISTYLDYQVSNTLKTATALMEPIMLVVVGISVGAMMMAIITPIYGLIGQVNIR